MIIEYIKINNFRQFTGPQTINFSVDSEKKFSLIIAESGVGKTTLIQCFQWILYGECKYTSPLNDQIKNSLISGDDTIIECSMKIKHNDKEYVITRRQKFFKQNTAVRSDGSYLTIDIKNKDGLTDQKVGKEASKEIKDIIHKDLFPYFFLEGENLTDVGEHLSRGKAGKNKEFVDAIKGLLGFTHLYNSISHLSAVIKSYQDEIAKNTKDDKLQDLIKSIKDYNEKIELYEERLTTIDEELEYNRNKRDEVNEKIISYKGIEKLQLDRRNLALKLNSLINQVNNKKNIIMKKFSSQSIFLAMRKLSQIAEETLTHSSSIEKGIPGINIDAIDYLLKRKKCLCGNDLVEGSEEWNRLEELKDFLPPNNIGFEIKTFNNDLQTVKTNSENFLEDFEQLRKDYNELTEQLKEIRDQIDKIDSEIGDFSVDLPGLKQQERDYEDKVIRLSAEKKTKTDSIVDYKNQIENFKKQQSQYVVYDEKVKKLQSFLQHADLLYNRINTFCLKQEKTKRKELQDAINEIFKDFYEEEIQFIIDDNYGVQIKTFEQTLSEDFTSGGQDVAVALAFIGAINKIHSMKVTDSEDIGGYTDSEVYPLVLDAPTSNFGMKQMNSFSQIMPKITDQVIIFINDKDGPILKELLNDKIGAQWSLIKTDSYHSYISGGNE